jgi:hypothetical protein
MAEAMKEAFKDFLRCQATAPRDASQHFRYFPVGLLRS